MSRPTPRPGRLTAPAADVKVSRVSNGIGFWIHVTPRARRPAVGGVHGDALRVAVHEPPVEGRANAACIAALARAFEVSRSLVSVDAASKGRRKRVEVGGNAAELEARLHRLAASEETD